MTNNMVSFLALLAVAVLMGLLIGIGSLLFGYGTTTGMILCVLVAVGLLTYYRKYWPVG